MILKITYLGHSAFLVETYDGVRIVIDPYNDNCGYTLPKDLKADILLVSHAHPAHCCLEAVGGTPAIYQGAGYRECGWVKIKGLNSFHDDMLGKKYGSNTIFCWDMRAVKLCHLGDLGHFPDPELLKQIGTVDIIFVPIGARNTLELTRLEELLQQLKVKYIIPMKYRTKYNEREKNSLSDFLKDKKNVILPVPRNEFVVDRKTMLEHERTIVALEYLEPGRVEDKK